MSHRLQRYLDDIINTPIPPDVIASAKKLELDYVKRVGEQLAKRKSPLAKNCTAAEQRLSDAIAEIAQIVPLTIAGILSGEIPSLLDRFSQSNRLLVTDLTHTIVSAAIKAYLDQNRETVAELIPILSWGGVNSPVPNQTDQEKRDYVQCRLSNIIQKEVLGKKIEEWLRSTTDSGSGNRRFKSPATSRLHQSSY